MDGWRCEGVERWRKGGREGGREGGMVVWFQWRGKEGPGCFVLGPAKSTTKHVEY